MSLAGLSLGIGMLVDNSIVVMENIYRLRARGVAAPRAAVQGTRQVFASIVSSTLTSVCVFLPVVFTKQITRELMLPMCLTIGYCLMASLLVGHHGGARFRLHHPEGGSGQKVALVR